MKLAGLAVNSNVTLAVSSGSVGGTATVATTGCPADCTATFEAANFATLSDDGTYSITVTATDSAGNAAVPRSERTAADATETLIAAVDTWLQPRLASVSVLAIQPLQATASLKMSQPAARRVPIQIAARVWPVRRL